MSKKGRSGNYFISKYMRKRIFNSFGDRCVYCAAKATTVDHLVAASLGGSNKIRNLRPACRECNELKSSMSVDEFIAQYPDRLRHDFSTTVLFDESYFKPCIYCRREFFSFNGRDVCSAECIERAEMIKRYAPRKYPIFARVAKQLDMDVVELLNSTKRVML